MLLALLRLLWQSFPEGPHKHVGRPVKDSVEQHAGIIAALRTRDAEASQRLTHAHVLGAVPLLARQGDGATSIRSAQPAPASMPRS
jgi:DNA-binding GntR family transcriptional regulator